jgi:uncharacterized protein YraI
MNKNQEKVLVAALCGVMVVAASAFAVQPAMASGYSVERLAKVSGVANWDQLNVRKWPAAHSQQVGGFKPGAQVWVDRCIQAKTGADWCLVQGEFTKGWVNSSFLSVNTVRAGI